ncbi:MAG: hypothetical protein ACI358_00500 [Candidatus Limimorpha sp.]
MVLKKLLFACLVLLPAFVATAQEEYCDCAYAPQDNEYKVALMVPLYLEQVTGEFFLSEPSNKTLNTKPFSFLHFYEGFMIAVDSVVNSRGMNIELKVYDVDNSIAKAEEAIKDPWLEDVDLIVGPFYFKPFEVVRYFADERDVMIINPITPRSNIVEESPNVVKIKPSLASQMVFLDSLIRRDYHSNNVFVVAKDAVTDAEAISEINNVVRRNIDEYSYVGNRHIVDVIKKNHRRWKYLKIEFQESDFLTDNISLDVNVLKRDLDDSVAFRNNVVTIDYSRDSLKFVKNYASALRNNLFIVYGTDKVFANEIVNKVTKLTENYQITVIMLPEWSKYDGLFNENLMKMHAIYFDDEFVDYNNIRVGSFLCKFRDRFLSEPTEYAFLGFDIGWYFLNALHHYGEDMKMCIPYYHIPLLQTEFKFKRESENSGLENTFWNVYQFKGYNKVLIK